MATTFRIDEENNADTWWAAARDRLAADGQPDWMDDGFVGLTEPGGPDEFAAEADAELYLAWCRALPGWTGGPAHAPHPLVVR